MIPSPAAVVGTLAWGTLVGLDLVSVPQGLLSRPLVAATVAGWMVGNVTAGLAAGVVLELYALDVLPVGASRYPDYSVAAVAGGVAGGLVSGRLAVGVAGLVALPMAAVGGWTLQALRRWNATSVQRRLERVAVGDGRAIWELQRAGMLHDALRSLALSAIGIGLAILVTLVPWQSLPEARLLSWAVLAGGVGAALGGAVRSAGRGARLRWLTVGVATGCIVVLLQ